MRVVVVPRWAGTPSSDWYPWALRELSASRAFDSVVIGDMPDPGAPTLDAWPRRIDEIVGDADPSEVVLVGHSVGCQALLRYLVARPTAAPFRALLCVAGWWTVDAPWPTILPWIETPLDHEKARSAVRETRVLLSDNDPFTSAVDENRSLWEEKMGASVEVAMGAKHFNAAEEPVVLQRIAALSRPL